MSRRIVSLLVVAVMGLSLLPSALADETADKVLTAAADVLSDKSESSVELNAAETKNNSYLYYKVNGEEITITGCDTSAAGELEIPAEIDGLPVTSIGPSAFYGCSSLISISIGNSVKSIGRAAFAACSSLTSITIPDSVTSIGDDAFEECTSLTSVSIGDGVTSIGYEAFYKCTGLTSVSIGSGVTSIGSHAFYKCTAIESVYITDLEAWCNIDFSMNYSTPMCYVGNMYINGTLAKNVAIPDVITEIKDCAFYGCSSLKNVTIPDSVTSIGDSAFKNCSSLESVTIGNGVTRIESETFEYCTALTNVTMGDGITDIGLSAFRGCSSLTSFKIPKDLTSIDNGAFGDCESLTDIYLPNADKWLEFSSDLRLIDNPIKNLYINDVLANDFIIPDGTQEIESKAFYRIECLKTVTVPASVTSIGNYAFYECTSLETVTIKDSESEAGGGYDYTDCSVLGTIGRSAFKGCTSLSRINIPDSAVINESFYNCSSLTDVYVSDLDKWIEISSEMRGGGSNPIRNLYINNKLAEDLIIPNGIEAISDSFRGLECLKSVIIPNSVTEITYRAFHSCKSLEYVSVPENVKSIGQNAFSDCISLKEIDLSNGLETIGAEAFNGCASLKSITMPNSVTKIYSDSFNDCKSLKTVFFGNGIDRIDQTFDGCSSLETIYIPESITVIGADAFSGCNALKDIYYEGEKNDLYNHAALADTVIWHYNSTMTSSIPNPSANLSNLIGISVSGGEEIVYNNDENAYAPESFTLDINVSAYKFGSGSMNDAAVTVMLTDGFSFYEDSSVRGRKYTFDTLPVNTHITEIIYVQDPEVGEAEITIRASAENAAAQKYTHTINVVKDDFDVDIYRANWVTNEWVNGSTMENEFFGTTPSSIIYDEALKNGLSVGSEAWSLFMDTIDKVDDPSKIMDYAVEEKDMYSAIIFNIFESAADCSATSVMTNEITKDANSLLSSAAGEMKKIYGINICGDDMFGSLTDEQKETLAKLVEENLKKQHPNVSAVSKCTGYISEAIDTVSEVQTMCENIAAYYNIACLSDSMVQIMRDMYNNCPKSNLALKSALSDCIDVINKGESYFSDKIFSMTFAAVGKNTAQFCISEFWDSVKDVFVEAHPAARLFQLAYATGKLVSNTVFNADSIQEKYCKIMALMNIKDLMNTVYSSEKSSFNSDKTSDTAKVYLSVIDVMFNYLDTDCESSIEYVEAVDDAWAQKLMDAFGDTTVSDWKEGVENIKNSYHTLHISELSGWADNLETDDPIRYERYKSAAKELTETQVKKYEINCPVDVFVFAKSGKLVGYVKDNIPYCVEDANITLGVVGDRKILYTYGDEYTICYQGNDTGTMDLSITESDTSTGETRIVSFYDVALEDGVRYIATDAGTIGETDAYTLTGASDEVIKPDYDSLNDFGNKYTVFVSGGYVSSSMKSSAELSFGESAEITAYVPEGYKFICWTSDLDTDIFDDASSAVTKIHMPAYDVNITASVEKYSTLYVSYSSDTSITVKALNCEEVKDGTVILAVYDSDGTLKNVFRKEFADEVTFSGLDLTGCSVKAMLWDSVTVMKPITESKGL